MRSSPGSACRSSLSACAFSWRTLGRFALIPPPAALQAIVSAPALEPVLGPARAASRAQSSYAYVAQEGAPLRVSSAPGCASSAIRAKALWPALS